MHDALIRSALAPFHPRVGAASLASFRWRAELRKDTGGVRTGEEDVAGMHKYSCDLNLAKAPHTIGTKQHCEIVMNWYPIGCVSNHLLKFLRAIRMHYCKRSLFKTISYFTSAESRCDYKSYWLYSRWPAEASLRASRFTRRLEIRARSRAGRATSEEVLERIGAAIAWKSTHINLPIDTRLLHDLD